MGAPNTPRTTDRGQTLQDFAIGIGIFIIAFVIVLSLFPGLLFPFQSATSGSERAEAQTVSTSIVSNNSVGTAQNNLSVTEIQPLFDPSTTEADLQARFGLSDTTNINITIETLDGESIIFGSANEPGEREVATSTRIVTMNDPECAPACRLVVRVW